MGILGREKAIWSIIFKMYPWYTCVAVERCTASRPESPEILETVENKVCYGTTHNLTNFLSVHPVEAEHLEKKECFFFLVLKLFFSKKKYFIYATVA